MAKKNKDPLKMRATKARNTKPGTLESVSSVPDTLPTDQAAE